MTKTLTEQWREGTLPKGYYYIIPNTKARHQVIFYLPENTYTDGAVIKGEVVNGEDGGWVVEVLAPVPSYRQLYGPNDGNMPTGVFTVLKIIKRDIERWQKTRPLTDLECGIKSQVVSLLKRRGWDLGKDGLVSNSDKLENQNILLNSYKKENKRLNAVLKHIEKLAGEYVDELVDVKRKAERLEKRLEIATGALREYANCKPTEWMSCVTADKALKEMEGVK